MQVRHPANEGAYTKTPFAYHDQAIVQRKGEITQVREIQKEGQSRRTRFSRQLYGHYGVAQEERLNKAFSY